MQGNERTTRAERVERPARLGRWIHAALWAGATLAVVQTSNSAAPVLVDAFPVACLAWGGCACYWLCHLRGAPPAPPQQTNAPPPCADAPPAAPRASPDALAELQAALANRDVMLEAQSDELARVRTQAEEAQRVRGALLAEISREVRAPLTTILGFADLLLCEALPDAQREALVTIRRNGEQLVKVLQDVQELAQLEAGRLEVEVLPSSPRQLATDVLALTRQRAAEKGLPVEFAAAGDLPDLVRLDPARCRQILLNLVHNAVKFTTTGRVTLGASYDADDSALVWTVRDTGAGIAPGRLPRLFQVRWQPGDQPATPVQRPALGLAVCKELVERLGGAIDVHSAVGEGTEFRVRLPAPRVGDDPTAGRLPLQVQPDSSLRRPTGGAPLAGRRVLLAEDGPDNRRLFATVLSRAGATLSLAEDGQVACQLLEAELTHGQPFDLVVIDMQMPVCDGYLATQRMRALGYRGPIVALTASSLAADRDRCLAVGCDDYLCKPVDFRQLIDTLALRCEQNAVRTDLAPVSASAGTR